MLLFYQISAWVFLIHMFLYAGFYCINFIIQMFIISHWKCFLLPFPGQFQLTIIFGRKKLFLVWHPAAGAASVGGEREIKAIIVLSFDRRVCFFNEYPWEAKRSAIFTQERSQEGEKHGFLYAWAEYYLQPNTVGWHCTWADHYL